MFGLINHREYDSEHYYAELLAGDLRDTLKRWTAVALDHPDPEDPHEPPAARRCFPREALEERNGIFEFALVRFFCYTLWAPFERIAPSPAKRPPGATEK